MRGVIDTVDTLIIGPTMEPLDLDEVKKHLRFSTTTEDTLIDGWITGAREDFERETGVQVMDATREQWQDAFPCQREIELPRPPLQTVVSVKYDDADGVEQTFDAANYRVQAPQGPLARRGRIALVVGASWPVAAYHAKAVRIRYTAGYGPATGDVPQQIKSALYLLVANYHKFRSEVHEGRSSIPLQIPLGAQKIIDAFKWSTLQQLVPHRSPWSYGGGPYLGGGPWPY